MKRINLEKRAENLIKILQETNGEDFWNSLLHDEREWMPRQRLMLRKLASKNNLTPIEFLQAAIDWARNDPQSLLKEMIKTIQENELNK